MVMVMTTVGVSLGSVSKLYNNNVLHLSHT
jgi:hypothetical protein